MNPAHTNDPTVIGRHSQLSRYIFIALLQMKRKKMTEGSIMFHSPDALFSGTDFTVLLNTDGHGSCPCAAAAD